MKILRYCDLSVWLSFWWTSVSVCQFSSWLSWNVKRKLDFSCDGVQLVLSWELSYKRNEYEILSWSPKNLSVQKYDHLTVRIKERGSPQSKILLKRNCYNNLNRFLLSCHHSKPFTRYILKCISIFSLITRATYTLGQKGWKKRGEWRLHRGSLVLKYLGGVDSFHHPSVSV